MKLRPCDCGRQPPDIFQRGSMIGSGPYKVSHYWVQCDGTPPCETGLAYKDADKAIAAWNEKRESERERRAKCTRKDDEPGKGERG